MSYSPSSSSPARAPPPASQSPLEYGAFTFSSVSPGVTPELTEAQRCFKITLLVVNTVFLIGGACMCAFGAYALNSDAGALSGATLPAAVIVLGVFTLIMALMGCAAVCGESRVLLSIYFAALLIMAVVSLFVGILILAERDSVRGYLIDGWNTASTSTRKYIEGIFMCCGLLNVQDGTDCPPNVNQTCLALLDDSLQGYFQQAGIVCIVFSVFMLLGMVIVCVLMKGIKDKRMLEELRERHRRLRAAKANPRALELSKYTANLPLGNASSSAAVLAAQSSLRESAVDSVRRYDRTSMLAMASSSQSPGGGGGGSPAPASAGIRDTTIDVRVEDVVGHGAEDDDDDGDDDGGYDRRRRSDRRGGGRAAAAPAAVAAAPRGRRSYVDDDLDDDVDAGDDVVMPDEDDHDDDDDADAFRKRPASSAPKAVAAAAAPASASRRGGAAPVASSSSTPARAPAASAAAPASASRGRRRGNRGGDDDDDDDRVLPDEDDGVVEVRAPRPPRSDRSSRRPRGAAAAAADDFL